MQPDLRPGTARPLAYLLAVGAGIAIAALSWGFLLDAKPMLYQPDLFWPFLFFGLCGSLLGWRIAMRHDNHPLRNLVGLLGSLVAWRVSYFPFMVVGAGKPAWASGSHSTRSESASSTPPFCSSCSPSMPVSASSARPRWRRRGRQDRTRARCCFFRKLFHKPPRKALWALACVALPVAGMVSFSTARDFVLFNDGPDPYMAEVPISEPQINPYARIMDEHDLAPAPWVLAVNAAVTYPLVPHTPWGDAMAGTLEKLALANPVATTRDRIDEHYQAWIASHARIRDPDAGKTK
ncbi:MAG: hypothetical protein M5U25_04135 [Planctomycetota bacterium]|nr:hypothetical protein [Planctomycetota bacterium]